MTATAHQLCAGDVRASKGFSAVPGVTSTRLVSISTPTRRADNTSMEPVSPELALVDPLLRAATMTALPEPGDCLARRPGTLELSVVSARSPERLEHVDIPPSTSLDTGRSSRTSVPERSARSLAALMALLGAFLFSSFLGSPVLELFGEAVDAASCAIHDTASRR